MQLTAPTSARPATAWSPVRIQLDVAMRPVAGDPTTIVVTQRMQLPTSTTTAGAVPATVHVRTWRTGSLVGDERIVGAVSAAERRQAVAVRDALLASSFLRDSRQVATPSQLQVGSLRITVESADGSLREYMGRLDAPTRGGLAGLDDAAGAYFDLVFPEIG